MGSLNLCWRRVLQVIPCKLSSHPSLKDMKAIPTSLKEKESHEGHCSCQLRMRQVGAALRSVKSRSGSQ